MSTRVSVCLASYNGERFIAEQLISILRQLNDEDEVIVVDDASKDRTVEIVAGLKDPRVRLIARSSNEGVVAAFELAIRNAGGEFIFLSDQDDLWAESKVSDCLEAFRAHPEAMVIVSDAKLIDQDGKTIAESNFTRRRFLPGLLANLFHSRYVGCTMAFRSALIPTILPFPREFDVLHDIWIGTKNHVTGGGTHFIEKPLTLYRRHGENQTGVTRLTWGRRIRIRLDLLKALKASSGREVITQASYTRMS